MVTVLGYTLAWHMPLERLTSPSLLSNVASPSYFIYAGCVGWGGDSPAPVLITEAAPGMLLHPGYQAQHHRSPCVFHNIYNMLG